MAVRSSHGFRRFALSFQYHGSPFLGVSYQGNQEDTVLPDGTDLRGYRSVEGCLREALTDLCGEDNFENLQISSRTDRGVHALKNTCHVDLRERNYSVLNDENNSNSRPWDETTLLRGLNFFLSQQTTLMDSIRQVSGGSTRRLNMQSGFKRSRSEKSKLQECRVLSVLKAPSKMKNFWFDHRNDGSQPEFVDWNARFSATERTYVYRILTINSDQSFFGIPFEHDRSWRVRYRLDLDRMKESAQFLLGTHDFTSFRGANCQRHSPIVTVRRIRIRSAPYYCGLLPLDWMGDDETEPLLGSDDGYSMGGSTSLVTIQITGEAFLYRQVRNMVGCLVDVGAKQREPEFVQQVLDVKNRSAAPMMAPAHGLFLADVKHGDFLI